LVEPAFFLLYLPATVLLRGVAARLPNPAISALRLCSSRTATAAPSSRTFYSPALRGSVLPLAFVRYGQHAITVNAVWLQSAVPYRLIIRVATTSSVL
jgi:hypothetical protein